MDAANNEDKNVPKPGGAETKPFNRTLRKKTILGPTRQVRRDSGRGDHASHKPDPDPDHKDEPRKKDEERPKEGPQVDTRGGPKFQSDSKSQSDNKSHSDIKSHSEHRSHSDQKSDHKSSSGETAGHPPAKHPEGEDSSNVAFDDSARIFDGGNDDNNQFFSRLVKRQQTMKTSNLLQGLGLIAEARHLTAEGAREGDVLTESMSLGDAIQGHRATFPGDWIVKMDEEMVDTSDGEGKSSEADGIIHKEDLRTCLAMHQRATYLHQLRTAMVGKVKNEFILAKQELQKVESRLDSKLAGMAASLEEHRRDCAFLRKGLERQLRLQLANVANRGWFKTGRGGNVDLTPVMRPFFKNQARQLYTTQSVLTRQSLPAKRDQSSDADEEGDEDSDDHMAPSPLTLDKTRPLYKESVPIPTGGRTQNLVRRGHSFLRDGNGVEGASAEFRIRILQTAMALKEVVKRDKGDYSVSPLEKAKLKLDLFSMTNDESILEDEDWQHIFPRTTDPRDLHNLLGVAPNKTAEPQSDAAAIERLRATNNVFTHIYLKGSFQGDSGNLESAEMTAAAHRDQRSARILEALRKRVVELRDDEDTIYNLWSHARKAIPRYLQSSWIPARFRDYLMDEAEILRLIRERYYRDKIRKERLTGILPDGLSACPLDPPPPPRMKVEQDSDERLLEQLEGEINESDLGKLTLGWKGSGEDMIAMSQLTGGEYDEGREDMDDEDETTGGNSGQRLGIGTIFSTPDDPFSALNDRQFQKVFLNALEIDSNKLLTSNEDTSQRKREEEGKDLITSRLPGFNKKDVELFSCQSKKTADMLKHREAISDAYHLLSKTQPAVVLEVKEPIPKKKSFAKKVVSLVKKGGSRRARTSDCTYKFFQLDSDPDPVWIPTYQRSSVNWPPNNKTVNV